MRTRIIALIVAAVLAIGGGVVLVNYVRTADARAFDGAQLTSVLVVAKAIPAGTTADDVGDAIVSKSVPAAYVVEGAVTDATAIAGLIAAVDLAPGEQVLSSRFVTTEEFGTASGSIIIPDGLQEVSIAVDAQRVVGGRVSPGDTVGVFVSLQADEDNAASTRILLSKVLVTSVAAASGTDEEGVTSGLVLVGLAVNSDDAQKLVYSAEFGRLWLSKQHESTTGPKTSSIEREGIAG